MAIRQILKKGDEILEKKAHSVTVFDKKLHTMLDDMCETLQSVNGVGLAAPQIGVLRRVFIVNKDDKYIEFINPEIIETDGEQRPQEGCLSLPGIYGITVRPRYVKIRAQNRYGKLFELEDTDLMAQAFSHEYDHLEGIIFDQKVIEWLDTEDKGNKQ